MKSYLFVVVAVFFAIAHSKSLLENDLVKLLLEKELEKDFSLEKRLSPTMQPVIYDQDHGYACFGKDNHYYPAGSTFYMFDNCYKCSYDSKCNLSCKDAGSCEKTKMKKCNYRGMTIFSPGEEVRLPGTNCYAKFEADCSMRAHCYQK